MILQEVTRSNPQKKEPGLEKGPVINSEDGIGNSKKATSSPEVDVLALGKRVSVKEEREQRGGESKDKRREKDERKEKDERREEDERREKYERKENDERREKGERREEDEDREKQGSDKYYSPGIQVLTLRPKSPKKDASELTDLPVRGPKSAIKDLVATENIHG